jgi:dUTPase
MQTSSVKYTLELFPVDNATKDLYINNLNLMYPNHRILNNGSRVYYPNGDNAGVDLWTARNQTVSGTTIELLDLGVKARMTQICTIQHPIVDNRDIVNGVHYWLAPRSSIWKNGVTQANSIGVIDKTYRGNLMGAVQAIDKDTNLTISIGQGSRLFQVVAPDMGYISEIIVQPLSALDETSRGAGGFGSTG